MAAIYKSGAVLVLALLLSASANAAESEAQKIERLERAVDELKQQIEELKRELVKPEPTAPQAAAAPTPAPAAPAAEARPVAQAEAALAALAERVQIGAYGSTRFESDSADGLDNTFTLRRLVLTGDAAIAPRMRSYFELEFERFRKIELEQKVQSENGGLTIEQGIEGTNESEISLEQAWLEYELARLLRARIGGVLVPLGRFNLNHDDNRWDLPRRSLVDRGVPALPVKAAWDEVGAGLNGEVEVGQHGSLGYQLYVVNGAVIQPEVESELESQNEEGQGEVSVDAEFSTSTGTFGNDFKNAKTLTGRAVYSPFLGQEIAGSFYRGRYTPDFLPDENITAFGVDGLSIWGPFELEGEYIHSDFGDVDALARAFAASVVNQEAASAAGELETKIAFGLDALADRRDGYWIEPRYRFRPAWLKRSIFGRAFEDPVLAAVVRWEQVWLDGLLQDLEFTGGEVTALQKVDRRVDRFTIGGSYRPVPPVVFQLAYEYTRANHGALAEVTNFLDTTDRENHAVLVGAAFGF
ncbi:MAG TPA: hypothetical protein VLF14_09520 [Candidatus Binatia bacterium]|nr:hypothetical protein [Candidatus Binatia bacterium]